MEQLIDGYVISPSCTFLSFPHDRIGNYRCDKQKNSNYNAYYYNDSHIVLLLHINQASSMLSIVTCSNLYHVRIRRYVTNCVRFEQHLLLGRWEEKHFVVIWNGLAA
eukprot:GHVO01000987.1.p1 GENE.GHVO01000987.1~~GHVO01000987.1.p1  ORF type:complete len:107 (-),score=0.49 GHVO01000987.1:34-354(-)